MRCGRKQSTTKTGVMCQFCRSNGLVGLRGSIFKKALKEGSEARYVSRP